MTEPETLPTTACGDSRAVFLRRALVASGVVVGGGALAGLLSAPARSAPSPSQDQRILAFLLSLEQVQEAFYATAVKEGGLTGEVRSFANVVARHEREHVAHLTTRLGSAAKPAPGVKFEKMGTARRFLRTAVLLEDAAVAAYNGQSANLTKDALRDVIRISSVEGRHAAWVRDLSGVVPAPRAADPGEPAKRTLAAVKAAGVVLQGS